MKFHACRVEFLTTGGGRARLSENFDVTKDERSRKVNSATASVKFHTRLWNFYDKRGGEGKGGGEGGKEREKGFQDIIGDTLLETLGKFCESGITCIKFYTRRVVTGK